MSRVNSRRVLRALLAVAAIVFAVLVYRAIRVRQPPDASSTRSVRTDPTALAESVRGESLMAKGTVEDFKVSYERMLTYEDGTLRFEKVVVRVPQRDGRDFTISGARATVTNQQNDLAIEGDVQLTTSDGLTATAQSGTFQNADGVLRVPGPVTFTKGRLTGRGTGATYDRTMDVLTLLADAAIDVAPDDTEAGALTIASESAVFARAERYLRFEGSVRLVRGTTQVEADSALGHLMADADILELLELSGHARLQTPEAPTGALEEMSARDMNLRYGADGRTLRQATLAGDSVLVLAGPPAAAPRRLAAELIDVELSADGTTPVSLAANDNVVLELPGDRESPVARRVKASRLDGAGQDGRGLSAVRFAGDVEFHEARAAWTGTPALERLARSRTLDAVMRPGLGALTTATFGGGVSFRDGDTDATAPDAVYDLVKGSLSLTAAPGTPVRVRDLQADIESRAVVLGVDSRALVAEGDVRSALKPGRPGVEGPARRRPSLLRDDQPINVTGRQLAYDPAAGTATYTGDARLWQGDTALQAASITLDDRQGNLAASTNVRSVWQLNDTHPKSGRVERQTTIATGDDLKYDESRRVATYTKNARMVGPEGDLRSNRLELFLVSDGSALERLEAYEAVTLRSAGRVSSGQRLTYFGADARYVMVGSPVRVLEQLPSECRETVGRSLTFYRSTDTILVDGNERDRTQTRSGGKCPPSLPVE
ncbi:MAG: LPS export ABC transporter periplasmic protein LptC [Vicinamibacterales bacterium]